MQHKTFGFGSAGELFQCADMMHTNIIRFAAAQFTNAGFQPVCQGVSSVISYVTREQVLHIVVTLVVFTKTVVVKFT